MKFSKDYKKLNAITSLLCLFCTPAGIYANVQFVKFQRAERIGDIDNAICYANKIKKCGKIVVITYSIIAIIGIVLGTLL